MIAALLLLSLAPHERSWMEDLEAARARGRASGRPVFALFASEGCRVCREFERGTLASPKVTGLLDRFLLVRIDVDRQRSVALEREIRGVPTVQVFGPGLEPLLRVEGAAPAEELTGDLERVLAGLRQEEDRPVSPLQPLPEGFRRHAICGLNVGYGPLALPSQSPFQSLRMGLLPQTPSTLARGQVEVSLTSTWVNVWALDEGEYFLDYEMLQSGAAIRYGLTDVLQLEAEYSHRSRFGGSMDGLVQEFHDLAGIDQSGRDEVPRGDFSFDLGGGSLENSDRGSFSESVLVTLRRNLGCGDDVWPALSASVTVRADVRADDALDGPPLDAGVSLAASKSYGDFYFYLAAGFTEYGSEEFQGVELRPHQFAFLFAVEWRVSDSMAFVLQHLASQGVARDFGPFSDPSHELTLGWKVETSGAVFQLGLVENLFTFDNSPDFGIHAGWTLRM